MTEPSVPPHGRASPIRLALTAVAGAVAIGAAVMVGLRDDADPSLPPTASATTASGPAAPATVAPAVIAVLPTFDVVRVNPRGDAVMAGHAAPGAEVRIEEAGREIGRTLADQQGEWVFVPSEPLPPGGRALTLAARSPDGWEARSEGSVLLVIPDRNPPDGSAPQSPLAVVSAPGVAPVVLQPSSGGGALGLEAADLDEHGAVRLAGRAPPGEVLRIYIDGAPVGDARADAHGHWTLSPAAAVPPGDHRVRLDQLGANGRVIARAVAPLPREAAQARMPAEGQVVVEPGQTLWRLARRVYGSGARYTLLYQANRAQIQDPRRIYPGQTFAVPALRGM